MNGERRESLRKRGDIDKKTVGKKGWYSISRGPLKDRNKRGAPVSLGTHRGRLGDSKIGKWSTGLYTGRDS